MAERIIGLVACIMCAVPFLIIARYDKDSRDPVGFWSGDKSLKEKVKNVKDYNIEMAKLYGKCAIAFLLTGIIWFIWPLLGTIAVVFECTVGIYIVWKCYKKVLGKYS